HFHGHNLILSACKLLRGWFQGKSGLEKIGVAKHPPSLSCLGTDPALNDSSSESKEKKKSNCLC
ncbi:hypothetical protein, partial [Synechococcus sp. H55.11]|uniref:hypothetical protein n=1 Tax=Synechococcus sp. H55.11 TaxID=2967121 RepID=UPI0039C1D2C8